MFYGNSTNFPNHPKSTMSNACTLSFGWWIIFMKRKNDPRESTQDNTGKTPPKKIIYKNNFAILTMEFNRKHNVFLPQYFDNQLVSTKYVWGRTPFPNQFNHAENPTDYGPKKIIDVQSPNQTSGLEGSATWTHTHNLPSPCNLPKRSYVTQKSMLANQTITNCILNLEEQT